MMLRSFLGWAFALACSLLINAGLFGLMPGLQGVTEIPKMPVRQTTLIRICPPPTPPRKEPEKSKEPMPLKKMARPRPERAVAPTLIPAPRLAFQLNSKLPVAPMDIVMPRFANVSMDLPLPKSHYTMGELDSPLTPLVKNPPVYPMLAARRGIEGYVTVEFFVTTQGLVEQIQIIEATPERIFDKSVINCVSHWKFAPGTVEGLPVNTLARTTIRFKLEEE
jgi:periplasmic protein TonB